MWIEASRCPDKNCALFVSQVSAYKYSIVFSLGSCCLFIIFITSAVTMAENEIYIYEVYAFVMAVTDWLVIRFVILQNHSTKRCAMAPCVRVCFWPTACCSTRYGYTTNWWKYSHLDPRVQCSILDLRWL